MISMQQPKTPSTPKDQSGESKTLFVGNLSFQVEQADVYVKVSYCIVLVFIFFFWTVYLLVMWVFACDDEM